MPQSALFSPEASRARPTSRNFSRRNYSSRSTSLIHCARWIADSADAGEILRSAHLLAEPVGLALRVATECPIQLNLRPVSVVRRQELERRRPYFVLAAACFVLGLLAR